MYFNDGAVYFHLNEILDFLKTTFPDPNRLLSLEELLTNKFNVAGKIVTSPYWHIVENCDNISSMNKYLDVMKHRLIDLSNDA